MQGRISLAIDMAKSEVVITAVRHQGKEARFEDLSPAAQRAALDLAERMAKQHSMKAFYAHYRQEAARLRRDFDLKSSEISYAIWVLIPKAISEKCAQDCMELRKPELVARNDRHLEDSEKGVKRTGGALPENRAEG